MPRYIRTPEEIFATEKKDIFFIEFADPDGEISPLDGFPYIPEGEEGDEYDSENPPARQDVLDWFFQYLPEVLIEPLAPPESSGFIAGGVKGRLRIAFDDASLQVWCAHWEDENGDSTDPRLACFRLPFSEPLL